LLPTVLERFMDPGAWPDFLRAARLLAESLGLELRATAPLPEPDAWLSSYLTLQNLQVLRHHQRFLEQDRPRFGSLIGRRFGYVLATNEAELPAATRVQRVLTEHVAALLQAAELLVVPSAPGAAPRCGSSDDAIDEYTGRALSLNALASLCGSPQLSMPFARTAGCPLGVSLVGAPGTDLSLLELCCEPSAFSEKPPPGTAS
jgi:amidase